MKILIHNQNKEGKKENEDFVYFTGEITLN